MTDQTHTHQGLNSQTGVPDTPETTAESDGESGQGLTTDQKVGGSSPSGRASNCLNFLSPSEAG